MDQPLKLLVLPFDRTGQAETRPGKSSFLSAWLLADVEFLWSVGG
jgi:hypothetical protein